jgi:hypothetical protein
MVLPTGVSPRMDMASRQRFSGCGESRCAYKLRLSAAMYAQMYAQTWVQQSASPQAVPPHKSAQYAASELQRKGAFEMKR